MVFIKKGLRKAKTSRQVVLRFENAEYCYEIAEPHE
jgi:hypothetical protein